VAKRRQLRSGLLGSTLSFLILLAILNSANVPMAFGAVTPQPTQYPWPMFHHNLGHTGYTESPAPSTAAPLWNYTTGYLVLSSPAVVDGRVFIGSADNRTCALDQSTGAKIWEYTTGNPVLSSPAVVDGRVFIGSIDNKIYALNQATGAKIWEYTTGGWVYSSPAVADGKVFVGSADKKVYALDQATGAKIWEYTTGSSVLSSPAVADGKVFIGSYDYKVYALDQSTGTKIWEYATGGWVYSSPAVADGKVFVGSADKKVYALDQATGAKIWEYTTGNSVASSPAVAYGKVFVGSADKKVYALDQATGAKIWEYTTGDQVYSSPAVADGKVFVGSYDYKVYALNQSTGAKIWEFITGGEVFSSPAVADGRVFVGSGDNRTYAFGTHNIAVTGVTAPSSGAVGDLLTVNATVENKGDFSETLDVTIYYDSNLIKKQAVTNLAPGASKTLSFSWNTAGVFPGNYVIKVLAETVTGETDTADNEATHSLTLGKMVSTITLSLSSMNITIGSDIIIEGSISPVRVGVTVTIQYRPSGGSWNTLAAAITDAAGSYAYTWAPEAVGTYEVRASWGGDATTQPDESDIRTVTVRKIGSTLTISVSPAAVNVGSNVVIEGSISPVRGGVTVTIQYRPSGGSWSELAAVTTSAAGSYTYTWTPSTQGTYEIKARWEGDATTQPDESDVRTVTVQAAPFPIPVELLIGLIGAGVAAVALVLYLKKRPKKPKEPQPSGLRISADPGEIFADGKSTSDLTIELVDADGNAVSTEADREVSISATEGKIAGSVVIPKGKSSVRATLTSSTTVGTVAVSASSRDLRGARVEVTFKERKRYCMHCGQRMPLDARICPSCGNVPPSGVDTKVCKNCSSIIPIVAKFCSECGASQPT